MQEKTNGEALALYMFVRSVGSLERVPMGGLVVPISSSQTSIAYVLCCFLRILLLHVVVLVLYTSLRSLWCKVICVIV